MKILHVIHRYPPAIGGSEVWLREIAQRLAKHHGHRIEVRALAVHEEQEYWEHYESSRRHAAYGERDVDGPIDIIRHRATVPPHWLVRGVLQPLQRLTGTYLEGPHSFDMYRALPDAIRDADVVHLHAHPYPQVSIGLWLCRRIGRPAVVTPYFHPDMPEHLAKRTIRALAMADRIFVLTDVERAALAAYGLDPERMVVTGGGVDVEYFERLKAETRPPAFDLSRKPGVGRVVFVGRKTEYKEIQVLIEAVRRVREFRPVELMLVGPTSDWFRQFVDGCSPADRSWMCDLGVVSDAEKVAVLQSSDVLVQPSRHESFGIVFLEAWACGLPVIGVDAGAVPSVIAGGGLTFRAGDAAALAEAIGRLLNDPETARSCAEVGASRNRQLFDWKRLADTVSATYRAVRPRPRRVLVVSGIYPPYSFGGAEVMARIGAVGIAGRGHEVQVLGTYRDSDAPRWKHTLTHDEGTLVHHYSVKYYDNFPGYARHHRAPEAEEAFAELIARWRPEVVHFHNIQTLSHRLIDIAEDAGIATLMTLHDYWPICFKHTRVLNDGRECPRGGFACLSCRPQIEDAPEVSMVERNAAVRGSLDRLRLLLAPAQYIMDRFVENDMPRERLRHHPYGIDLAPFARVAAARQPRTPLRFGFIGYIGDHKGIFILAEAVKQLVGDFKLLVYGVGDKEPDLAAALSSLGNKVEMRGPCPHDRIAEAFAAIDVMVLPALWPDNFPVSIIEALASATVVVASRAGGMTEQIRHDENGYLVPMGDVAALASTLQGLIDEPARVARLAAGAQRSADRYPLDLYLDRLEEYYEEAFHSAPRLGRTRPLLVHSGLHNDSGGRDLYRALGELSRRGLEIEALALQHATDTDLEQAMAVVLTPGADDAVELALRAVVYRRHIFAPRSDPAAVQLLSETAVGSLYSDPFELATELADLVAQPHATADHARADTYLQHLVAAAVADP